jgi:hypothetical protein
MISRSAQLQKTLDKISQLLRKKLRPKITIVEPRDGAACTERSPKIRVVVTWTTCLADGSFKALFDREDVTNQFNIDYDSFQATALLKWRRFGSHRLEATGEFLKSLPRLSFEKLSAESTFSVDPG